MRVIVRDDLAEAHRLASEHLAACGTWWIGVTSTGRLGRDRSVPPVADDVG
jgi:hypothetical protein